MWTTKPFSELSATELFNFLKLRVATFVVAQKRIYQEVDDNDAIAVHVFDTENDEVIAYARVFKHGETVTFGRVVTAESHRGTGLGNTLMNQIMAAIDTYFKGLPIEIEAQVQVQGYYGKFGFTAVGDPFIFESTPHIKMVHDAL